MISSRASVTKSKNAAGAVRGGTERLLLDAGQAGVNESQKHVPHGADSFLANSVFGPEELPDGSMIWGYSAEYARHVADGTDPHWAPIAPLLKWARRVLGDESAAYGVQAKIAEEGTDANPFFEKGVAATKAFMKSRGVSGYVEDRL